MLSKVAISRDAKALITICSNREPETNFSIVKLWLWSAGQNSPHGENFYGEKYFKGFY